MSRYRSPPPWYGEEAARLVAYRGQRGRVGAGGHPGPLLVVLRGAGPPVVPGRDRVPVEAHRGHARAAGVPPARRPAQRGAVPRPGHAVGAGRVLGGHLVGLQRVVERMAGRPQMPQAVVVDDHRVLHAGLGVARKDGLPVRDVELGRVGRLGHLHPPVLGPRGRAAQVQPPAPLGRADQGGPFQRLGGHVVLADGQQRLEPLAVRRARHRHRVAAALGDRPPEPVGEEDLAVTRDRARCPRPVPGAGTGRFGGYNTVIRSGQHHR